MIKITPIQPECSWVLINHQDINVSLRILDLGDEKVRQIAVAMKSLRDDSGNRIIFLTVDGGKVKFFRHNGSSARNEPVYVRDIPRQLVDELKFIELEVIRKWGELHNAWRRQHADGRD